MASSFSQKHEARPSVSPRLTDTAPKVIKIQGAITTSTNTQVRFMPEVDNGCQLTSIHPRIIVHYQLPRIKLAAPIPMSNTNGSPNRQSLAMHVAKVTLQLGDHQEQMEALILDIRRNDMLLGQDWLMVHNPSIDWTNRRVVFDRCLAKCQPRKKEVSVKKAEPPELDENGVSKGLKPKYINDYTHMFKKKNFDKLPGHREWDHKINLVSDTPKELPTRNYRMTLVELQALDKFVNKELKTGKIRPSKSPYAAPCFFITKKDGGQQLVQDYRKVNSYTVKDKTPLPRIDDMIDMLVKG
jgi:hypothetical protein